VWSLLKTGGLGFFLDFNCMKLEKFNTFIVLFFIYNVSGKMEFIGKQPWMGDSYANILVHSDPTTYYVRVELRINISNVILLEKMAKKFGK